MRPAAAIRCPQRHRNCLVATLTASSSLQVRIPQTPTGQTGQTAPHGLPAIARRLVLARSRPARMSQCSVRNGDQPARNGGRSGPGASPGPRRACAAGAATRPGSDRSQDYDRAAA